MPYRCLHLRDSDERDCSFCAHAILHGDLMVVPDARRDDRFSDNRLVLADPNIRFYAGAPITAQNGQRLGTLCVIDVRPRNLDEEQRSALQALARQTEAQLELRRAQLDKELLGRFIVHDLRNSLTSVLFNAQIAVRQAEAGDNSLEELQDLRDAAELSHRRVEDFHALLATQQNSLRARIEEVDVADMVRSLEAPLRPRLRAQNVEFETSITVSIIRADPDLLRRTLENLLDNALAVAPPGSAIRLDAWIKGNTSFVRVTDQGPGVPEDQRESIFDLHQTGNTRGSRASTGLGLTFCRMATKAMGASIRHGHPSTGPGAAFVVELPSRPDWPDADPESQDHPQA